MSLSPQIKPSIEAAILKNSRIISDPEGYDYKQLCMPKLIANNTVVVSRGANGEEGNARANGEGVVANATANTAASEGVANVAANEAVNVAANTPGLSESAVDNILILGDLLDSTAVAFNPPINNTNIIDFMKIKSFNIRNVNDVVNNKNIYVILGNRDLNKIKILPLLLFKNNVKWWDDGKSFEAVCNNLIQAVNNNNNNNNINPWLIKDLNEENMFAPIWNRNNTNYKTETWQTASSASNYSVLYRFNRIFGQDPTIGTMSADKILYTIPYELNQLGFLSDEYIKFGERFDMDDVDTKTKLAAAVLTFYMLVLLPDNDDSISNNIVKREGINLVGLFRKYYTALNTYVCASAHDVDTKKLFLFSHGGISKDFIENSTYTIKKSNTVEISKPPPPGKTGGMYKLFSYDKNITFKTSDEIITIIENYNTAVKNKINALFTEYDALLVNKEIKQYDISDTLLYLIIISTPYNNNGYDMTYLSPIMPGISNLRDAKHMVYSSDATIYNMFGHAPHGFAPVIDKYEATYLSNSSTRQILYLINCDISNSIIGNYDVAKMNNSNYSYLKFGNGYKLTLHQNITLKNSYRFFDINVNGTIDKSKPENLINDTVRNVEMLMKSKPSEYPNAQTALNHLQTKHNEKIDKPYGPNYKFTTEPTIATYTKNNKNDTNKTITITSDDTRDLFEMQHDIDKLSNPSIKTTINDTISLLGYFKLPPKTPTKPLTEPHTDPPTEPPTESLTTFILGCTAINRIVKLFRIPIPAITNTGGSYKYKKRLSNNKTKRYYKNKYNKYNAFKSSKNKKLVKKSKHKNKRAINKTHKI